MHKVVLASMAFVLITEIHAQRFMVRGGLNFSSVNATFQTRKIKYGTLLGVGFEYPLSKNFFIQPEFDFLQKGYKYEFEYKNDLAYGFMRKTLETNYLEIPILLKYRLKSGNVKYSFLIGPTVGGVIGGHVKTYSVSAYRLPPDIQESERTKKVKFDDWPYPGDESGNGFEVIEHWLELGLQVGGQVEFFDKVILDIRYGFGLTSFYSLRFTETVPSGKLENTKNRGVQFSISVPFKKL
jgi:hypothetical protein